jgi:hypothetical protein
MLHAPLRLKGPKTFIGGSRYASSPLICACFLALRCFCLSDHLRWMHSADFHSEPELIMQQAECSDYPEEIVWIILFLDRG